MALCSRNGLWWTDHWWWSRIALYTVLSPLIIMWIVTAPIFIRHLHQAKIPSGVSVVLWVFMGLPTIIILDVVMIILFPFSMPKVGWLGNVCRLQKFMEALLEAPMQVSLQGWIFVQRTFIEKRQEFHIPWTLIMSTWTTCLSLCITFLDIKEVADSQSVTIVRCFKDLVLVGQGRKAPLLYILGLQAEVTYEHEGALSRMQCEEIAAFAATCPHLRELTFVEGNKLDLEALATLTHTAHEALRVKSEYFTYHGAERHLIISRVADVDSDGWRSIQKVKYLRLLDVVGGRDQVVRQGLAAQIAGVMKSSDSLRKVAIRGGMRSDGEALLTLINAATELTETPQVDVQVSHTTGPVDVELTDQMYYEGEAGLLRLQGTSYTLENHSLCIHRLEEIDRATWGLLRQLPCRSVQALEISSSSEVITEAHATTITQFIEVMEQLRMCRIGAGMRLNNDALRALFLAAASIQGRRHLDFELVGELTYAGESGRVIFVPGSAIVSTDIGTYLHVVQVLEAIFVHTEGLHISLGSPLLQKLRDREWRRYEMHDGATCYDAEKRRVEVAAHKELGPEGCCLLKDLLEVRQLVIGGGNNIRKEGCERLKDLLQLTQLAIGGGNNIGNDGCRHLKELQHLEELRVHRGNNVGAAGLRQLLQGAPALRRLEIDPDGNRGESVTAHEAYDQAVDALQRRGVHVVLH